MKSKDNAGYLVALTLLISFGFLVLWEFWLEKLILVNYLEIEIHKNSLDRWTFIVSCLSIVCISLILPLKSMKNTSDEMKSLRTALYGEQALSKVFFSVDNSIILIINNSNKIMQINKKTSFLLGYKEEEMLGQDWISLLSEEKNQAGLKSRYQQFVKDKNQNFMRFSAPVKAKDGTEKIIDWQCSPLRDEYGKVYGSINSGQDITEPIRLRGDISNLKKKYEPQIKKLTSELNFNKKKYHSEAIKSANARSRFKFWFELENTLINLSQKQTENPNEIKDRIQKALRLFGELSNVDHGYIFKFTQSGSHMINTHLWVPGEPMLEPDPEEEISMDSFPWFKKNIQKKEIIHIHKVEGMPKIASAEKKVYLSQGIKSLINIPIIHKNSAVGYIGFESNEKEKKWDEDEINIIQVMARLISSITNPSSPSSSSEPQPEPENAESAEPSKVPTQEATAPIDKELRKVRESFEMEFQEKIKSMERAQSQLMSELKKQKEIEEDLRSYQDSIKKQLDEKSLELERFLAKNGGESKNTADIKADPSKSSHADSSSSPTSTHTKELEGMRNVLQEKEAELATLRSQLEPKTGSLTNAESKEFNTKITEKDNEIKSLRKTFEEEKANKARLEKNLNKVQESTTKHKEDIEVLETANQVMAAELEELRKVQEEFFTHSIELEDTQQELENLGIANEQLMTDIEEKNLVIEEAKEKAARYEQMDLPLFILDQDGNIVTWNKTAASVTGYIPELALEESISFMFEDRDNFDFESEFLAPLRENFKLRLEVPIKKPNGNVFNALISLASFKDRNGIISTLGYLVNLSETENEGDVKALRRHFTALLGNSGLTLLTLSPGYLISDMNEKAESTFQWNREETLGKNFFEIILSQENWEEVSSDIQGRMDTQASVDLEAQAMLKDKIKHSFLWTLVKEIDPKDESVQGILAIARDVTDIHEAQNELRENKLLMNMFLDKADDGVISIDENGIIQSFSDGAENLFGYTSDEIIGKNVSQLMPDPYSKEHDNYIRRYVDTGDSTFIGGPPKELTGKNKSGATFPIEITLKEIYKNYQRLFIGIVRDIRKRKEVEIQLAQNQEKYHRFMDAQSDAILLVDSSTQQILECNPVASQLCGYEPEEFMKLNFKDLVATTDQGVNDNSVQPITDLGSTYKIPQIYMIKKDGSLFPAKINTSSFRFEDTDYEYKIIRDISTEVQLNETLEQNEKLKIDLREEKSNMVEHIASSVVDLINNPIQGIENILEQVKERAEMADIHKGLVTVAMNECRRVANLIGKLKSYQPPSKENLDSLNVHKILDEVIQGNMNKINDRTITLEKNYANHLPSIDGVTPQIRQAIDNIVKNAEEALNEGEGKIIISTEQVGSNVKIHIQDTGCGIAETHMSRIFEPFFTTKTAMHRPGLGLLATQGIVKNHKGDINVQSEPGEGTTFTVTLPLKQPLNQNGGS